MANRAIAWKSRLDVVRILSGIEFLDVAVDTLRGRTGPLPDGVAVAADQPGVCTHESKPRDGGVVELRARPVVHAVALLALEWNLRCTVRRVGALVVVRQVASHALRAQSFELANSRIFVAALAGRHRVGADQRESVVVLARLLDGHAPALHGMTLLAIAAELPPVNIGVTGCALFADVLEDRVDVAGRACDTFMHAQQRPFGLRIVIKFRPRPNRLPCVGGVATLAGDLQRAMRIRGAAGGRRSWRLGGECSRY